MRGTAGRRKRGSWWGMQLRGRFRIWLIGGEGRGFLYADGKEEVEGWAEEEGRLAARCW